MAGDLGNGYLKTIQWGKKIHLTMPETILLSQSNKNLESNTPLVSSIVPFYNRKKCWVLQ